jgi:hypothetical protein
MKLEEIAKEINARGGKLAGVLVSISVPDALEIPLCKIQQAIQDHPDLDKSWAPETREPISLYLDAVRNITTSGKNGFADFIDPGVCGFYPEQHEGYICKKAATRDRYSNTPVAHTVFHCYKKPSDDLLQQEINAFLDDEDDEFSAASFGLAPAKSLIQANISTDKGSKIQVEGKGLTITLVRTKGTYADDKRNQSEFALRFEAEDGGTDIPPRYIPFVNRLKSEFEALTQSLYTGTQIRELMKKIIREKLNGTPLNGWYFAYSQNIVPLLALQETLRNLAPSIKMVVLPIEVYENSKTSMESLNQLGQGITESLVKDFDLFQKEIEALKSSDSKTRDQTWISRYNEFEALKAKADDIATLNLIFGDVIDSQIKDIANLFTEQFG